jgi:hypothetical protein
MYCLLLCSMGAFDIGVHDNIHMAGDLPKVLPLQRDRRQVKALTRTATMIAESWVTVLYSCLSLSGYARAVWLRSLTQIAWPVEFLDAAGKVALVSCLVQAVQIYKNG